MLVFLWSVLDNFRGFWYARQVVQTLLHELAHIEVDEHNADFHALNRELNREYATLSQGVSVGGLATRFPPGTLQEDETDLDLMAVTARSSGQPLSTSREHLQSTPREMAARAALLRVAEREQLITQGCGTHEPVPENHCGPAAVGGSAADGREYSPEKKDLLDSVSQAEAAALGDLPYEYRPRRGLRVGNEYQVAIPAYEGPPGPTAGLPRDELVMNMDAVSQPETVETEQSAGVRALPLPDQLLDVELQTAIETLVGSCDHLGEANVCLKTVYRVVDNILQHPTEAKVGLLLLL